MLDSKIIEMIEKEVGQEITTTACGKWLPDAIKDKTGVLLGETTLKRMFGFTSDPRTPHRSTLNVIAEFLGYKDYEALALVLELPEVVISDFEERDAIVTDTLNIGYKVELTYRPNRLFTLKYVGDWFKQYPEALNEIIGEFDLSGCNIKTIIDPTICRT